MSIQERIKDQLRPYKHHLQKRERLSWARSLTALRQQGLVPKTVWDIGVAYGTWELYTLYPEAKFHLVEPGPGALPSIAKIERYLGQRCQTHLLALSDRDGTVEFDEWSDNINGSTLFEQIDAVKPQTNRIKVRAARFDTLFPPSTISGCTLVKIDVQGAELMVLRGMEACLPQIDAILVEVSTIATLKDAPEVKDVITHLHAKGFVLADVLGTLRRPADDMVAQMDLLFVQDSAPWRQNKNWWK